MPSCRTLALLPIAAAMLAAAVASAAKNPDGVAVIIGNRNYDNGQVPEVSYAHRDAEAFKQYVVGALGYDEDNVIDLRDATQAQMESTFGNERSHKGKLWQWVDPGGSSDVVVFYSGHGVPGLSDGKGYLLPTNADPATADLNGYPIDLLYGNLAQLTAARSVRVYLDACFSGGSHDGMLIRSASPGFILPPLPQVARGSNMVVLTAASNEQVASWDEQAEHGLFTHHLLDALYGKGDADGDGRVTAGEAKGYLDRHMTRAARRMHRRDQNASLSGDTTLALSMRGSLGRRPVLPRSMRVLKPSPRVREVRERRWAVGRANVRSGPDTDSSVLGTLAAGDEIAVTGHVVGRDWLRIAHGGGVGYVYAELTSATAPVAAPVVTPAPEPRRRTPTVRVGRSSQSVSAGRRIRDCADCPELVVIPSGSYRMGSTSGDRDERPVHRVTIGEPFALGVKEVTFAQWDACVRDGGCGGRRPGDRGRGRGDRPVINVSWKDAQSYVSWLSRKTGESYRLPSESEWEYAARAGTRTRYSWGDDIGRGRANCRGCGSQWDNRMAAPVGSFEPNAFGLYDMHGNVWEWTQDCWNGSYSGAPSDGSAWQSGNCSRRVLRGGSWDNGPRNLRAANRSWNVTVSRYNNNGFRVSRRVSRTLAP